jgi:hypothetical protein
VSGLPYRPRGPVNIAEAAEFFQRAAGGENWDGANSLSRFAEGINMPRISLERGLGARENRDLVLGYYLEVLQIVAIPRLTTVTNSRLIVVSRPSYVVSEGSQCLKNCGPLQQTDSLHPSMRLQRGHRSVNQLITDPSTGRLGKGSYRWCFSRRIRTGG